MPSDKELLTTIFRCNVCNVISRGIIEHDRHLEGKRHKNNVAVASGSVAAPAPPKKRAGANSAQETKQERKKRLEHEAVARASLLLNPALQKRPCFTQVILNWDLATWSSGSAHLPLPAQGLPARFSSRESYLESWEPFLLEEARCVLQKGFEERCTVVQLTLRSFKAASDIVQHAGLSDPAALAFSMPDSSSGASGDGAAERSERIQSGSAVLLNPPPSLCRAGAGAGSLKEGWTEYTRPDGQLYYHHASRGITQWDRPCAEALPACHLGIVTQRSKLGVEIQLVLPAMSAGLEVGQGWECRLLASLASLERMYDSCVALRDALPERFLHHLLDAKPQALPASRGLLAMTSQASQELNASQRSAVTAAVNASLPWPLQKEAAICLLHGPPGTGKTTTIIACLEELRCSTSTAPSPGAGPRRVLVCAPSNKAVQELCGRYVARYPDVPVSLVGVGDMPQGDDGASLRRVFVPGWAEELALCIRKWMVEAAASAATDTKSLLNILDRGKTRAPDAWHRLCGQDHAALAPWLESQQSPVPSAADNRALEAIIRTLLSVSSTSTLSQPLEGELLASAELIFCTLATAGRSSLTGRLSAHALVVDEAGQAVEPEILVALRQANYVNNLERIVLVGDPAQLPATLLSSRGVELGFDRSMLGRLLEGAGAGEGGDRGNSFTVMLREQHRMHPSISQWPNKRFYQGKLLDAACVRDGKRGADLGVPLLGPYTLVDVSAEYCQRYSEAGAVKVGTSLGNHAEAKLAAFLLSRINSSSDAVAVITFYAAQVSLIKSELRARGLEGVRVATVDGFQGAEQEIVLLSFVRGHGCMGVGFLKDFRRLNVALTRARSALVLLADVDALSLDASWDVADLCRDAKERGVVVAAAALRDVLS